MTFPVGFPLPPLSGSGNRREVRSRSTQPCDESSVPLWAGNRNRARPFLRVNRSQPALCEAMSVDLMGEKNSRQETASAGRDARVAAVGERACRQHHGSRGGKMWRITLVGKLPRLQLIWAESASQGTFEDGVKDHQGSVRKSSITRGPAFRAPLLRLGRTWIGTRFSPPAQAMGQ